jgi:hypothetical protein
MAGRLTPVPLHCADGGEPEGRPGARTDRPDLGYRNLFADKAYEYLARHR